MAHLKTYEFADVDQRDRFMNLFSCYTGWSMENFHEKLDRQNGRLLVHQPFGKPIWMQWEITGNRVTFDETLLRAHYQGNVDHAIWSRVNEYAARFGAGSTSSIGLGKRFI